MEEAIKAARKRKAAGEKRRAETLRQIPYHQELILALPFNEKIEDYCPEKHKLTSQNVSFIDNGKLGKGARFHGNSHIKIHSLSLTEEGTWSLWIRIPESADCSKDMNILSAANGYYITIKNEKINAGFNDGKSIGLNAGPIPARGEWIHLALAWADGEVSLYVNGELMARYSSYSGKPAYSERMLVVSQFEYVGDMDELFIYRKGLDKSEIVLLMQTQR